MYAHFATVTGDTELLKHDYRAAGGALRERDHAPAGRRRLAQPRARLPLPLPAAQAAGARPQPRQRRVREHDLPLPDLVRAGAARRHGAARAGAGAAAARLGRAHRLRLLDARRLPELGHGLQLQALARRAAPSRSPGRGCSRSRSRPASTTRPRSGSGPSTCSTPDSGSTTRLAREAPDGAGIASGGAVRPQGRTRSGRACASCSRRACRPTPRAPSCWVSSESRRRSRRRSIQLRPRHRQACGHDSLLLDRDLPVSQHAFPYGGIELARLFDGSDAGPLAEHRRPAVGQLRRRRAQRRQPCGAALAAAKRLRGPGATRRSSWCSSPRGAVRRAQQYPSRPYAGSFDIAGRAGAQGVPGSRRRDDSPLSREVDRDALEDHSPQAGALLGRRAVSELGQAGRRSRPCCATGSECRWPAR